MRVLFFKNVFPWQGGGRDGVLKGGEVWDHKLWSMNLPMYPGQIPPKTYKEISKRRRVRGIFWGYVGEILESPPDRGLCVCAQPVIPCVNLMYLPLPITQSHLFPQQIIANDTALYIIYIIYGIFFLMFKCHLNPSVSKNQHLPVWHRYIRIGNI